MPSDRLMTDNAYFDELLRNVLQGMPRPNQQRGWRIHTRTPVTELTEDQVIEILRAADPIRGWTPPPRFDLAELRDRARKGDYRRMGLRYRIRLMPYEIKFAWQNRKWMRRRKCPR